MAPTLLCTVRGCRERLAREERTLVCPRGHSFDLARRGYVNLLQPHDRRSPRAGDPAPVVAARRRWLDAGLAEPLAAELERIVAGLAPARGAVVVDLGCGEGWFLRRLGRGRRIAACGIDLSVVAIEGAARAWPEATWVVANADRFVPLADASAEVVVSVFGRRDPGECRRVLRGAGALVVALPGARDLIELRQAALGRASERDRVPAAIGALGEDFAAVERASLAWGARLEGQRLEDALALTYRGQRRSERNRRASLAALDVTLAAEILVLRPRRSISCR